MRQTEGLIGSVIGLLGLTLAVPDHSTLSRRAETLAVPRPRPRTYGEPFHLLVDSTGLKLCGAGEWLVEKQGAETRRSWRKPHIGLNADTGQIVAAVLTAKEVDDGAAIGWFKQVIGDGLRSRIDQRRATEVDVAVHVLNRMLELGRSISVRIA